MRRILPLFFLLFGTSLLAQSANSNAVKEEKYALITLTKYCRTVETLSHSRQPRLFSQTASGLGPSWGWVEFSSTDAWRRAGQPQPLALVWYKDGRVARVVITARDRGDYGQAYVDYCYRPNGSLARLRSVPDLQTDCDQSYFHCSLTFRGERFYHPKPDFMRHSAESHEGKASIAAPPIDVLASAGFDRRLLKSERTSFTVAAPDWPEYLSVRDLPFNGLLYASTK
jgi:hypothetical protein